MWVCEWQSVFHLITRLLLAPKIFPHPVHTQILTLICNCFWEWLQMLVPLTTVLTISKILTMLKFSWLIQAQSLLTRLEWPLLDPYRRNSRIDPPPQSVLTKVFSLRIQQAMRENKCSHQTDKSQPRFLNKLSNLQLNNERFTNCGCFRLFLSF